MENNDFTIIYKFYDNNIKKENTKKYIFTGNLNNEELEKKKNNNKDSVIITDLKIYPYDTIYTIKQYLVMSIDDIYNVDSIFLYYEDENNNNINDYEKIYKHFINKNNLDILLNYNFNKIEINKLTKKIITKNYNYDVFLKIIKNDLDEKILKFKPLGFKYLNKKDNIIIDTDILNNIRLDEKFISENNFINLNSTYENNIIGSIKQKILYLYNFKNIHEYIENNNLINLESNISKNKYIEQFVRKYFYKINNYEKIENLKKIKKKDKTIIDNYKKIFNSYIKLSDYIENNDYYLNKETITNFFYKQNYNFSNYVINTEKIFDLFELDYNIPFLIFNDDTGNYLYKFNKNIYLEKKFIDKWISHVMYNHVNDKTKELFLNDLTFKIFYGFNKKNKIMNIKEATIIKIHKVEQNEFYYDLLINDQEKFIINFVPIDSNTKKNLYDKIKNFVIYEPIYFDLNLLKNGDFSLYANFDVDENIIIEKIKKFFKKLNNSINYLLNNKLIKLNYKNENILINAELSYNLPKEHTIDLNTFNKIINCYKSFLDKSYNQYKINDIIHLSIPNYFNKKATIKSINMDGTYNIEINEKQITIQSNNILETNNQFLNLSYKKINNYKNLNVLQNLVYKLKSQNKSKNEIIDYIQKEFLLNKSDAENYLIESETDKKVIINKNIQLYVYSNELIENNLRYKIKLYDIESYSELNNIKKIINSIILLYKDIVFNKNNKILKEICNETEIEIDENVEDTDESDSDIDSDDSDDDDDDIGFGILSDYEKKSKIINEEIKNQKIISKELGLIKKENYFLQRLYLYNKDLFSWYSNKNKQFSRLCQPKERYPIVIDDNEKRNIDNLYPNSYKSDLIDHTEQSCDLDNIDFDTSNSCNSIKIYNHWYICPKIFCVEDKISLDIDKLFIEKPDKNIKCSGFKYNKQYEEIYNTINNDYEYHKSDDKILFLKNKHKLNDSESEFYKNNQYDITFWRICANCNEDITKHSSVKCPICKKGILKKTRYFYPTENESLYIIGNKEQYYYPGLMKNKNHPDGLYPPCCFTNANKFDNYIDKNLKKASGNYVEKFSIILENKKWGVLPDDMNKLLNNNKCSSGYYNNVINCFIRKGFYTNNEYNINNSFFNTLIYYFDQDISIFNLKKYILKKINKVDFLSLNYGNLENIFRGNIENISPFQNYLEYIISNQKIQYEYLWHLFSSGFKWLPAPFNEGVNILIFEIDKNNNESILIPNFYYNFDNKKYIILLKNNDQFESIVFKDKKKINKFFNHNYNDDNEDDNQDDNEDDNENNTDKIIKNIIDIIKNSEYNQPKYYEELDEIIESRIIDNFNKIVGYILNNKFYHPTKLLNKNNNFKYINLNKIDRNKLLNYTDYKNLYHQLNKKYNFDFKLKYKVIEDGKIINILTDNNQIIPIKKSENIDDELEDTNNKIFEFNKKYNEKEFKYDTKNNIKKIINKLDKYEIINDSEDLKIIQVKNIDNTFYLIYDRKTKIKNINKLRRKFNYLVDNYNYLYNISNFELNVNPIRVIMNDLKDITHILLNNGSMFPVETFKIYKLYKNLSNKEDFLIHYINDIHYNIIDYNLKDYNNYNSNIRNKINEHNSLNIFYKKYLYEFSNNLNNKTINNLNKNIKLKNYKEIYNIVNYISNKKIYNNKDFCVNVEYEDICKIKMNDSELKNNFIIQLVNDLFINKILSDKIINKRLDKYVNKNNYIILNKEDINNNTINELYKKSKNIYIEFPNFFSNNDINKKYIKK